jgi:SAM-dependent methyltransferase
MNQQLLHNQRAWDERVRRRLNHTRPASEKVFTDPAGMADIYGWIGRNLSGQHVLCLGAGGGRHGPIYAAAGATVTVVDISPAMLELDHAMAQKRGLTLHTLAASMDDLSQLRQEQFDLVVQPISTCYVPDVTKVYQEVARVTRPGGLYISQHKQPANLQASAQLEPGQSGYVVQEPYYRQGPLPSVAAGSLHRESECLEFLHRWEDLLGGLCRSGFVVEDLLEPHHGDPKAAPGTFGHRSIYIPPYVTFKGRRLQATGKEFSRDTPALWIPDRP